MIETIHSMKLYSRDHEELCCIIEELHHRLSRCTEDGQELRKQLRLAQYRINDLARRLENLKSKEGVTK